MEWVASEPHSPMLSVKRRNVRGGDPSKTVVLTTESTKNGRVLPALMAILAKGEESVTLAQHGFRRNRLKAGSCSRFKV